MSEVDVPSYRWDEEEIEEDQEPQRSLWKLREIFTDEPEEYTVDPIDILEEVMELKQKLEEVAQKIEEQALSFEQPVSLGEIAYRQLQKKLEKTQMGKVVAIDVNKKQVAGVGNTIEEAFKNAKTKMGVKKFYFKKVGQQYLSSF